MSKWRQYRALSRRQRSLLLRALVLLPLTAVALRVLGLRRLKVLGRAATGTPPDTRHAASAAGAMVSAVEAARMVAVAARWCPFRAACLLQSIVLQHLLRRRGIETELCVGAYKHAGRLEAHAWVELMGQPVNQPEGVRRRFGRFRQARTAARPDGPPGDPPVRKGPP
ncbi:MAG: lasso peptide biosynthesis B2 protein [Candidatus Brocadiaceae bacterium]|nr:lasso peptide biosynthesis B2 protein [Candidatus Brocadiaceae bacterium]